MVRQWFYLDPFNRPRGPVSDVELDRLLTSRDYFVFAEGMEDWTLASELFASDAVAPLAAHGPANLDDHGQPRNRRFGAARRADSEVQELLGLAKGIIADGVVTDEEANALRKWMRANAYAADVWPLTVLSDRLGRIFADGRVDDEERAELFELLCAATGEKPSASTEMNRATRLPLNEPQPELRFTGSFYVFTGKFAYGTRAACQQVVQARGGECERDVTQRTNVLVIGILGSEQWMHSTHGRKIEKAVHYRANGLPLAIVSEEHWASQLRV